MQRLRPLVANFRRITDGNPLMQRLSITRPQKPVRYSVMETTMVMKKTLMLLAMSAVLAGSVSTLAQADGTEGRGPMPMLNFDAIDTDKDGSITTAEFDAFRAAEFSKADTNSDGQVSADELAAKQLAEMTLRAADMAAKMIERMDANADGQLSAEEMANGPRAPSMFERVDADGNGSISKAEVEAIKDEMGKHGKHHRQG